MLPNYPAILPSSFASNGDKTSIPQTNDPSLGLASFEFGFPPITQEPIKSGGIAPRRNDFNGIFNALSEHIVYYQSGSPIYYSEELDYSKNSIVFASNNNRYKALQDNGPNVANASVQNPINNSTYWKNLDVESSSSGGSDFYIYSRIGEVYSGSTSMNDPRIIIADGRSVDLADYPEMLEKIYAGDLPILDAFNEEYEGLWSFESGTKYKAPNFIGRVAKMTSSNTGFVEEDAMRNITAKILGVTPPTASIPKDGYGALTLSDSGLTSLYTGYNFSMSWYDLDSSIEIPVADEVRVKSILQLPLIYMGRMASELG